MAIEILYKFRITDKNHTGIIDFLGIYYDRVSIITEWRICSYHGKSILWNAPHRVGNGKSIGNTCELTETNGEPDSRLTFDTPLDRLTANATGIYTDSGGSRKAKFIGTEICDRTPPQHKHVHKFL